jgi:hypothetical protein
MSQRNRARFNPVLWISLKGKFVIQFIRALFAISHSIGLFHWEKIKQNHHEDPKYMKAKDLIYFSHKYYCQPPTGHGEKEVAYQKFPQSLESFEPIKSKENNQTISISIGGDLMPYECITETVCEDLWSECGAFFFNADIVTANLETPIDQSKAISLVPELMLKNMYFNGNPDLFDIFNGQGKYKGFDVLSVANNHSLDQGTSGILATMRFLENRKIAYCGAALSEGELDDFPVLNRNGINVAFLGTTFSLNALSKPKDSPWIVNHMALNEPNPEISLLIRQSNQARMRGADLIMAHLHMGCAYQALPSLHTVDNMHLICEQTGIDVLIGSHPHNIQPLEIYTYTDPWTKQQKQSLIIYSLGDFIAYDIFKWCHLPMMLNLKYTRIDSQVVLSELSIKLGFMEALIAKGKVQKLLLRDFNQVRENPSFMSKRAANEFNELLPFADFLLENQGSGRFLV